MSRACVHVALNISQSSVLSHSSGLLPSSLPVHIRRMLLDYLHVSLSLTKLLHLPAARRLPRVSSLRGCPWSSRPARSRPGSAAPAPGRMKGLQHPAVIAFLDARSLGRYETAARDFRSATRDCNAWRAVARRLRPEFGSGGRRRRGGVGRPRALRRRRRTQPTAGSSTSSGALDNMAVPTVETAAGEPDRRRRSSAEA